MQFEWDEAKNLENIRKHQIDFADVPAMFDGEMLSELDDSFDYGEYRWFGSGSLGSGIAIVVWTERQKNVIRIISARRANRHEQI
ncbi:MULTISPECIES: BrnT family toxin [unclassified Microcoleus]|uniref:BrnT family toxin n=1 Tax=unclassified Microcoleus TaxID=2642155 RepID=UPI002FCF6A85